MVTWTEKQDELLRKSYSEGDLNDLSSIIGVSVSSLRSRAAVLKIKRSFLVTQKILKKIRRGRNRASITEVLD